jgi:hypothetical protein
MEIFPRIFHEGKFSDFSFNKILKFPIKSLFYSSKKKKTIKMEENREILCAKAMECNKMGII